MSLKHLNTIIIITPHLKSFHWLKITQRIQYKILSHIQITSIRTAFFSSRTSQNDIDENIKSDIFLFADNLALLNKFKNKNDLEIELNSDLKQLNKWAQTWSMDFNPNETEMFIFSNKKLKSNPNFYLKDVKINQVSEHKHLGLILSENMKWTTHIDYSIKMPKKIGLLRRQKKEYKNHTNIGIDESKKNNPLIHSHEGYFGKISTQIKLTQTKLKLSPLRSQLINYNSTDNPFCPSCNDSIETPLHFFLECNTHQACRQIMLANLLKLNPKLSLLHIACWPSLKICIRPS